MVIAFVLCAQVLGARSVWAEPQAESNLLENVEITAGGGTFTVDLNLDDKTALVWDIKNPEAPTSISIPASFEHEGATYVTTELQFSMWDKRRNVTGLILPNTLTSVGSSSFYKFPELTEMTIPGSIKVFGGSFQNMDKLVTLTFEEGVEEIASNSMLNGCEVLTQLNLPATLKRITGPSAFGDATALESVVLPEGIEITEGSLFSDCTSLKSFELPASVTEIPSGMFSGCTKLEKVTAKAPITAIGSSAFNKCGSLVEIPGLSEVAKIDEYAFNECGLLSGPVDLSNVTEMGMYAFYKCNSISGALDLSKLDEVPGYAFSYAYDITSIKLSDSVTSIGKWAFLYTDITELNLPETLQSIGDYAFWKADKLSETVRIPDSVTSLGKNAFEDTAVERFEVGSGLEQVDASAFASTALKEVVFNNSQDSVTVTGSLPNGIKPTYTQPSIDDSVGDKISDAADAPTLRRAVTEAAKNGSIVNIEKHIKLTKPVTVPAGKTVTITSKGPFQIVGAKATESTLKNLFVVEKGASLIIDGEVTLFGRYNTGSAVLVNGAFELAANAMVTASKLQDDRANGLSSAGIGVIDARGEGASIKISGGSIAGNALAGANMSYSGIVRVAEGASLKMTGGTIAGNKAVNSSALSSSSGILLYGNASASLVGGAISGNTGHRGSAVMLFGSDDNARTELELSGEAMLSGNTCTSVGKVQGSGAVHVEDNAEFTMNGGKIASNKGVQGAGVCVVDGNLQRGLEEYRTAFVLDGGFICDNVGSTGGGIYSYTNGVSLKSGSITGNTAYNMGGGVYSEGNNDYYSTLNLSNALIAENTARQGGGMWFCATGETTVHVTEGAAIFDNVARDADGQKAAGDDFVFSARKEDNRPATLANRLLGGGLVQWYRDGGVYLPSAGVYPTTSDSMPRYGIEGADPNPVTVNARQECLALKAVPFSDEVKAMAKAEAKLVITGNTADKGGGIGSNGGVTVGREDVTSVAVSKVWKGDTAEGRPTSIEVELLRDGRVIDRAALTVEGGWAHEFADLPVVGSDGEAFDYAVSEVEVPGYTSKVSGNAQDGYIITNTKAKAPDPTDPEKPGGTEDPEKPGDQEKPGTPGDPVDPQAPGSPGVSGGADVPDVPGEHVDAPNSESTVQETLPQAGDTAMLFVAGTAGAGVVSAAMGAIVRKRRA